MFSEFKSDLNVMGAKARAFDKLYEYLLESKQEYASGVMMSIAESHWGKVVTNDVINRANEILNEEMCG